MRNLTLAALLTLCLFVLSSLALAQPRPVGPVVPLALEDGTGHNFTPHVAFDAQGRSSALWFHRTQGGTDGQIALRRYGADGSPVGPQVQVNQYSLGLQKEPELAMNAAGFYVAAWTSYSRTEYTSSVYARLFRWRTPVTGELAVSLGTPPTLQGKPRVGIDAAGNFIVVWQTSDASTIQILARLYAASGAPRGPAFRVTNPDTGFSPDVSMRPDGSFTVVWQAWNQGSSEVYARRFGADGTPRGDAFQVSQDEVPNEYTPAIGLGPDGSAVVAWVGCGGTVPDGGCSVAARRLGPNGRVLGGDFLVGPHDGEDHQSPDVAFDGRGSFAITWTDCLRDAAGPFNCRIQTSFFAPSGALLGRRVIDSDNNLIEGAVAGLSSGFVVAWDTLSCDVRGCPGEGLPQGVFAQRYAVRLP